MLSYCWLMWSFWLVDGLLDTTNQHPGRNRLARPVLVRPSAKAHAQAADVSHLAAIGDGLSADLQIGNDLAELEVFGHQSLPLDDELQSLDELL